MSAVKSEAKKRLTVRLPASHSLEAGDRVVVDKDKVGQILWVGSDRLLGVGAHYGVRLLEKRGTCDGSIRGKRLFQCPKGYGLIVRRIRIKKLYKGEEFDFAKDLEPNHSDDEVTSVSLADGSTVGGKLASERRKKGSKKSAKVLRTKKSGSKKKPKKVASAKKTKTASGLSLKKTAKKTKCARKRKKKWKSKVSKVLIVERDVAAEHIYLLCAFWFRSESVEGSVSKAARIPSDIVSVVRRFLHKIILGRPSLELKQALELDHADVLRMLHAQGVDILSNAPCCKSCTALEYACKMGHVNCIDALLEAGADPRSCKRSDGITHLMLLAISGHITAVKKLLALGCDIHAKATDGSNVLFYASCNGHIDIIKLCVEHGVDLEARGSKIGMTPFLAASSKGLVETAVYLAKVGADLDAVSDTGHFTGFMLATMGNSIPMMNYFLERGCDVTERTPEQCDAFMLAVFGGHLDTAKFIVEHSGGFDLRVMQLFKIAVETGHFEATEVFLALDTDVNALYDAGKTLLMSAAASGRLEMAKLLLQRGADVLAIDENKDDALAYATKKEHFEVADFLQLEKAKALSVKEAGEELSVAESKDEDFSESP